LAVPSKPTTVFRNALSFAADQLVHQAGVAQRQADLGLVDDLRQLPRTQHRHGVHYHRAGLGRGQPAGNHRRVVGGTDQHPIARPDRIVLDQGAGDAVGPVAEFLVGAVAAVADQRGVVAEPLAHHGVGEFDCGVQSLRIGEAVERQIGPLVCRRQAVAGEGIDVRGKSQHVLIQSLITGRTDRVVRRRLDLGQIAASPRFSQ
jgi:hypothetical protein